MDTTNHELMNNPNAAFDIASEELKKHYMFMGATNSRHSENPNTLFFKHSLTRENIKIKY